MIKYDPSRDETIISCDYCPNEEPVNGKVYEWKTCEFGRSTATEKKHCCSKKCYYKWYAGLFSPVVNRVVKSELEDMLREVKR